MLDSGRVVEASVFAPKAWEGAQAAHSKARALQEKGVAARELQKHLDLALQYARQALAGTTVAQEVLAASLLPRKRAREAKAHFLVPVEYMRAEDRFTDATRKVESGHSEEGLAEARKSEPLFDAAELSALHKAILATSDSLLTVAEVEKADRFAPVTLAQAQAHRTRSYELIIANRHERTEALAEAARAEYEARHAAVLAKAIKDLTQADRSWEELLREFESETRRVAKSAGENRLRFDSGLKAATDSVVARVDALASDLTAAHSELEDVSSVLSRALSETGESSPSTHPVELATQAGERLTRLTEEKGDWARMAKARQAQLAEVSQMADETAYELAQRREREEKFKAVQQALTESEGSVLYNTNNDIVLRLVGLSFDPGKSDLLPEHDKILAKVEAILKQFPGQRLLVEGHTDARGSKGGNLSLSEKRATAVRDRLMKDLTLEGETVQATGYGDEHPVASNSSASGRAKNRRIDVVILQ